MEALMVDYGKGLLKSSVGKLGSLLLNEALLIGSVREDILFIRDELQSMDAVVSDMIQAKSLDHQNKVWMLHVLQVACDAELCMDEFAECFSTHRGRGIVGASLRAGNFVRTVYPRYRIAKMIQKLKIRAMEVSQRRSRYNITIQPKVPDAFELARKAAIARPDRMHLSYLMPEDALVGKISFKTLLANMKGDSFKVIAIVGPAGFGKTALAKMVYRMRNNPDISFEKSAWVTLSTVPDRTQVLENILRQVDHCDEEMEYNTGKNLTDQLRSQLAGKRFLLILDALQSTENWTEIKNALPQDLKGRIILTTRKKDVAKACCSMEEDIMIEQKFTNEDSKMLCQLMVLNIPSKWYGLVNLIKNCFNTKKKQFIIVMFAMLPVIVLVMWGLLYIIQCIFHLVRTIHAIESYVMRLFMIVTCSMLMVVLLMDILKTYIPFFTNTRQFLLSVVKLVVCIPQLYYQIILAHLMYIFFIMLFQWVSMLLQWSRYFNLTSVNGVPLYRVHTYIRLNSLEKFTSLCVPLTMKFICGALVAESMDSHKSNEFFQDLRLLFENKRDADQVDQHPEQLPQQMIQHVDHIDQRPEQETQQIDQHADQIDQHPQQKAQQTNQIDQCPKQEAQQIDQHPEKEDEQIDQHPEQEAQIDQHAKQRDQEGKQIENEKKLMEVIECCHQILSPALGKCAEDLNILPEGYAISRKRLMRRWVDLDLVSPKPGLSKEQVAESYFDELMLRGFIEVESLNSCGNVKSCRVNSMFKEYLTIKLRKNLSTTNLDNNQQTSPHDNNPSFQLYDILPSSALEHVKDLSSLDCYPEPSTLKGLRCIKKKMSSPNYSSESPIPNYSLESLTIIDLEGCKDLRRKHLSFLHRCRNLRFLSLRDTKLTEIPEKIGELKNLETLDVRQTGIKKIPKDILDLPSLKHLLAGHINKPENSTGDLEFSASPIEVPVGMEEMSSLQTLTYVEATRSSLLCVRALTQLKRLGLIIRDPKLNFKPLSISLMMLSASLLSLSIFDERNEKNSLEFLEYLCFPPLKLKSLTLRGSLERLPQWIGDHKCLTKLIIADTLLRSDAIRLIGKIPTLLCLKLYSNSIKEHDLTLEDKEFPVLRVLLIHCDAIQKMSFEKGTAPRLEVFRWVFSKAQPGQLVGIPNLPMLKEVSLIGDVDCKLEQEITAAVKSHTNYKTMLVFEKIEPAKNKKKRT